MLRATSRAYIYACTIGEGVCGRGPSVDAGKMYVCINTPTSHVHREEERGERKTREYKKRVGRKMGENAEGGKERREEDKEGRNEEEGYN